nr:uncharacterized protein LOC117222994 [Megalopta genalis]XP_033330982.1 uncharacterized protein LOC117223008 [Megalopta genalis]XP_033339902.1 uncharacterized protein LOC117228312 [Megalopta genalis]
MEDAWNKSHSENSKETDGASYLQRIRDCLAAYQESNGVPNTEYSFATLIKALGQATSQSLLALLYVILNIIPVAQVFLFVLRFILDKMISIRDSKDFRQMMIRSFVFLTELFSVYICLFFIFGFIILPIVQVVIGIIVEIMLYY